MKFLVIEDKKLTKELRKAGFSVDVASVGEAEECAAAGDYDVLVLSDNQTNLLKRLRQKGLDANVLVLGSTGRRLVGMFRAWRRLLTSARDATRLSVGDVTLDLRRRLAWRGGQRIDLQPNEFSLLEIFLRKAGAVLTKDEILRQVWGYSFDPGTNVVDVLVYRLRTKIDKGFDTKSIVTVRGSGYLFRPV